MPSSNSLVAKLQEDYPNINITAHNGAAYWSASQRTVFYNPREPHANWVLLHEVSHALLDHASYRKDIELLAMERDAWHYATTILAPRYDLQIDTDYIEDNLDSYREWLHAKSTCPRCQLNGVEIASRHYRCAACGHEWRVNEARTCHIRRYHRPHTNTAP